MGGAAASTVEVNYNGDMQKPLTFRRETGSNVWHFNKECSRWPKRNYVYSDEPKDGAACKGA